MSLSILVDMNLSPEWVPLLISEGWPAVHWSQVGAPNADDATIKTWALANQHAVFTHDLDFTTLLAHTQATGPSVIQVRSQNVLPEFLGTIVIASIHQHQDVLERGALVVVDPQRSRVRILPL